MKAETKIRRTKRHDTLRRAKRAGRRVYPAHREHDDAALFESLGNGNGHTVAAPNYDNA